ncbi:hypothetical protein [Xanthomonas arboricola]|uniref:Antibiotic biosynthesis monooxygenase n=1 Tax=Xanthomonas arboricola pv. corylina TaxID=487821 RepID=A0ABM8RZM0_9XANT|nr:hypothetical protein [Xanthomonas arboricola]MDN0209259.1 hypothetical protein [Xanthomonas arboricola pv. corylina]MDN0213656.1 hypothetical protein [Xanthomonas arboricola pv. corylina]QUI82628.1 hypothetical protein ICA18_10670 [Xanthomonas arboricola pv. corylina]CAE6780096.1 hypothetical protein XAC301_23780 [Xanthomonas arboricola pv. corylina]CAE6780120.1 hypothetical protein XAC301_23780 [Xanthomonas arboricola pv. corylina]
MHQYAFFVRLTAKRGREKELETFLEKSDCHTQADPDIVRSFTMKEADGVYCLFHIFESETARADHFCGATAEKLGSVTDTLLRKSPEVHVLTVVQQK